MYQEQNMFCTTDWYRAEHLRIVPTPQPTTWLILVDDGTRWYVAADAPICLLCCGAPQPTLQMIEQPEADVVLA